MRSILTGENGHRDCQSPKVLKALANCWANGFLLGQRLKELPHNVAGRDYGLHCFLSMSKSSIDNLIYMQSSRSVVRLVCLVIGLIKPDRCLVIAAAVSSTALIIGNVLRRPVVVGVIVILASIVFVIHRFSRLLGLVMSTFTVVCVHTLKRGQLWVQHSGPTRLTYP